MTGILHLNPHREFFAQITVGTKQFDAVILTAYGFSAKKDLLAQFLALNQQVAAEIEKGEPVSAPVGPRIISTRKNW